MELQQVATDKTACRELHGGLMPKWEGGMWVKGGGGRKRREMYAHVYACAHVCARTSLYACIHGLITKAVVQLTLKTAPVTDSTQHPLLW